jgi:hypothetical protein
MTKKAPAKKKPPVKKTEAQKATAQEEKMKRDEEKALVTDEEGVEVETSKLGTIKVKPWTYGEYLALNKDLVLLFQALGEPDVDISLLTDKPAIMAYYTTVVIPVSEAPEGEVALPDGITTEEVKKLEEAATEEMRRVPMTFLAVAPFALPIVTQTLGMSEEELMAGGPSDAIKLFIAIWVLNWDVLGNAYTLSV